MLTGKKRRDFDWLFRKIDAAADVGRPPSLFASKQWHGLRHASPSERAVLFDENEGKGRQLFTFLANRMEFAIAGECR